MIIRKSLQLARYVASCLIVVNISSSCISGHQDRSARNEQQIESKLAYEAFERQDIRAALLHYERAIRETPNSYELLVNYADAAQADNRLQLCETLLIRAIKIDPDKFGAQFMLSQVYRATKRVKNSQQILRDLQNRNLTRSERTAVEFELSRR